MATACLPWREGKTFDEEVFRREIRPLRAAGLENLYVFRTAGKCYAVTDPVFKGIVTLFFDEMRGGAGLCQLGVIALSMSQIRAHIDLGMGFGFHDFQISPPSWGTVTDQ